MFSIKTTFTAAASGPDRIWMLLWAIAILDDSDRRAKQRRDQPPTPPAKPSGPAGPRL
jgi:hypothetical protein